MNANLFSLMDETPLEYTLALTLALAVQARTSLAPYQLFDHLHAADDVESMMMTRFDGLVSNSSRCTILGVHLKFELFF